MCVYIYIHKYVSQYVTLYIATSCNPGCPAPYFWQELMEDTSEFFVETLKAAFADRRCWRHLDKFLPLFPGFAENPKMCHCQVTWC